MTRGGDAGGRDSRHRRVHEPRAGARERRGQARGRLGVRVRALRNADRAARVSRATTCRRRFSPRVLKAEPDWRRLPAETPPAIRRLLRRCLQKDRKHRLRDIGDARLEIDEALDAAAPMRRPSGVTAQSRRRERLVLLSTLALVTLIAAVAMVRAFRPPPPAPESASRNHHPADDGSGVAGDLARRADDCLRRHSEGRSRLWLRSLDSVIGAAVDGDRWCTESLLVAGQPVRRFLCGWQAQADRHRRRIGADARERFQRHRRCVEPRRRDPVCDAWVPRSSVSPTRVVNLSQ